jgi:epoxyqueuosine reductase
MPTIDAIRAEAARIGFVACGVASLDPSVRGAPLDHWIGAGYGGTMRYLHRQVRKRKHPAEATKGARSAIVVLENYTAPADERPAPGDAFKIAAFGRGMDYHVVTLSRLRVLCEWLLANGATLAHAWVDHAPIPERELAERAGLGWIGKNTMLIHPQLGSYTFIGSVFTDLVLAPSEPLATDHCGSCTRCLDACPTQAFVAPRLLDATKCLSYLTIEYKRDPPPELLPQYDGWAFGCDVCNDVCPWNIKFAKPTTVPEFASRGDPDRHDATVFDTMTDPEFTRRFADTGLARPGLDGMRRNVRAAVASPRLTPDS